MGANSRTISALLRLLTERLAGHTESAALDSQVLIAQVVGKNRSWVLSHPEFSLTRDQCIWLDSALDRLVQGYPLPYILGWWEFFGLTFQVSPSVLIPRPETELLVEHALAWCRSKREESGVSLTCVDIGTGSGCIAISLLVNLPGPGLIKSMVASDLSRQALQVARHNAGCHQVKNRISFLQTDLLSSFHTSSLDLICANLPYIPSDRLPELPVARNEPGLALDGGPTGLEVIHSLLDQAVHCLRPGGLLLAEIEFTQGKAVLEAARAGFPNAQIELIQDLAGHDRMLQIQT